jgi:hypothetical protein
MPSVVTRAVLVVEQVVKLEKIWHDFANAVKNGYIGNGEKRFIGLCQAFRHTHNI